MNSACPNCGYPRLEEEMDDEVNRCIYCLGKKRRPYYERAMETAHNVRIAAKAVDHNEDLVDMACDYEVDRLNSMYGRKS